jgi:hypothetical protein
VKATCQHCRHWFQPKETWHTRDRNEDGGECRRNPPALDGGLSNFVKVKKTDWCGEHKEREQ